MRVSHRQLISQSVSQSVNRSVCLFVCLSVSQSHDRSVGRSVKTACQYKSVSQFVQVSQLIGRSVGGLVISGDFSFF